MTTTIKTSWQAVTRFVLAWVLCTISVLPSVSWGENSLSVHPDRDKVTVYDTGTLPFQQIAGSTKQTWVLAQVTPAAHIIGPAVQIDPVTHVANLPPDAFQPRAQGQFAVQSFLTGAGTLRTETYNYPLPWAVNGDNVRIAHIIADPFTAGGLVVCRIDETVQGKARYPERYVIPQEWQAFVVPAFAYYKSHAALFNPATPAKQSYPQLIALLHNPNTMLAVAACQALGQQKRLDANVVQAAVGQTDPMRQAALLFVVLTNLPDTPSNSAGVVLASRIQGLVNYAKTSDNLHGVALAVSTANDVVNTELVKSVINTLANARPSDVAIGKDLYVANLLKSTTVPQISDKINAQQNTPAP